MNKRLAVLAFVSACAADDHSSGPSAACRDHAPHVFRTRFVGSNLGSFEGRTVRVMTSIDTIGTNVECRAEGEDLIADGAFVARADNRRDDAVYPRLGAYVDVDGDLTCSARVDLVWTRVSIAPPPDQEDTIELAGDDFELLPDVEGCAFLRTEN